MVTLYYTWVLPSYGSSCCPVEGLLVAVAAAGVPPERGGQWSQAEGPGRTYVEAVLGQYPYLNLKMLNMIFHLRKMNWFTPMGTTKERIALLKSKGSVKHVYHFPFAI